MVEVRHKMNRCISWLSNQSIFVNYGMTMQTSNSKQKGHTALQVVRKKAGLENKPEN